MIPLRDTIPSARVPIVNYAVIAANVLVFCYEVSLGGRQAELLIKHWGLVPIFLFLQVVEIPAVFFLLIWFLWQLMSGVATLGSRAAVGGVAFWAHIGGFVAGMALGPALRERRSAPRWA